MATYHADLDLGPAVVWHNAFILSLGYHIINPEYFKVPDLLINTLWNNGRCLPVKILDCRYSHNAIICKNQI